MSPFYQGPAQVGFSPESTYDLCTQLSFRLCTITLIELGAGTYEMTITGSPPNVLPESYMRVVLPDGKEQAGRITSVFGSTIAFLGNVCL